MTLMFIIRRMEEPEDYVEQRMADLEDCGLSIEAAKKPVPNKRAALYCICEQRGLA